MVAQGDKTMFCTKYSILDWKTGNWDTDCLTPVASNATLCAIYDMTVWGNRMYFSSSEAWLYFYCNRMCDLDPPVNYCVFHVLNKDSGYIFGGSFFLLVPIELH